MKNLYNYISNLLSYKYGLMFVKQVLEDAVIICLNFFQTWLLNPLVHWKKTYKYLKSIKNYKLVALSRYKNLFKIKIYIEKLYLSSIHLIDLRFIRLTLI